MTPYLRSASHDLIDRAQRGDQAARHLLLEHYRDELRRTVAVRLDRRLAARVDASDIVQETLVEAADRLDEYLRERPIPFVAWLRQLAGERVIDAHRRHVTAQRRSVTREHRDPDRPDPQAVEPARTLFATDTSPSNHLMREERHERLRAALATLSPQDREVVVMRHLEQLSIVEIAATLEIGESAVKSRLLRALIRMKERMSEPN